MTRNLFIVIVVILCLSLSLSRTGIILNLFIESSEYIDDVSHFVGARIVIHDQKDKAFPDDDGIDLHPGLSTSIGLQKVFSR